MEKIQFYPNELLKTKLDIEATKNGISTSSLVVNILLEYYGLTPHKKLSFEETVNKVFEEIHDYIRNKNSGHEFDLLQASQTFKNVEMISSGKPSTNRARIGRKFSCKLKNEFSGIERVFINGNVKKSTNNATIYKIK